MKVSDLPREKIVVGLRVHHYMDPNKIGTIVEIDDDKYGRILWDGYKNPTSLIYFTHCHHNLAEEVIDKQYACNNLEELRKEIDKIKCILLCDLDTAGISPMAEQHLLLAWKAIEEASCHMKLAEMWQMREKT